MVGPFLEGFPPKKPDRFDRFTERAKGILTFANDEAIRRLSPYTDTEHLLLGLFRDRDCFGAKVLANLGVDSEQLLKALEESMANRDPSSAVGLTPSSKKVIQFGVDEARRLDHHYFGSEHLLLGLIREGDGIAAQTLQGFGIDLDRTRVEIIRTLNPGPEHHPWLSTLQQWRNFLLGSDQQMREKYVALLNDLLQKAQEEHNTPPENAT